MIKMNKKFRIKIIQSVRYKDENPMSQSKRFNIQEKPKKFGTWGYEWYVTDKKSHIKHYVSYAPDEYTGEMEWVVKEA